MAILSSEKIKQALRLEHPYLRIHPDLTKNEEFTDSAVAVLLNESSQILLTKRSQMVRHHQGEICFPGGVLEVSDSTLLDAATRELEEEVGITADRIQILGELPPLITLSSRFSIHPFVGRMVPGAENALSIAHDEIERVFWVNLEELESEGAFQTEKFKWKKLVFETPVYRVQGERIWGATAFMIQNFLERLRLLDKKKP